MNKRINELKIKIMESYSSYSIIIVVDLNIKSLWIYYCWKLNVDFIYYMCYSYMYYY